MPDLRFELVTPERLVMADEVHMVVVPGVEGEFGVMAGHAPFMSTLRDGELAIYRTPGAVPEKINVSGGFAEVSERGLTVLAESAAPASWRARRPPQPPPTSLSSSVPRGGDHGAIELFAARAAKPVKHSQLFTVLTEVIHGRRSAAPHRPRCAAGR